jgi:2-oxoglutarate dehydrogenase E2 component (dihydrolipoamide succinyltransferase)
MGDSITEGSVGEIVVQAGSGVAVDDVVARVDTDKVVVDIRSTVAGVLSSWNVKVGDTVKVGAQIAAVEIGASAGAASASKQPAGNNDSSQKQAAAVHSQADKPTADVGEKSPAPMAQSGAQAPLSTHPTDPADRHGGRVPSIHFRFGKREQAASSGHQHQGNQPAPAQSGGDFLTANEAAAAAWEALPDRYKRKALKEAQLTLIELGGAPNYESKKKTRAA